MKACRFTTLVVALSTMPVAASAVAADTTNAAAQEPSLFTWWTVVNSNDLMPPGNKKNFNSYNQPSVNERGLVVIRARSRGGEAGGGGEGESGGGGGENQPVHGIYTRDMSVPENPGLIVKILDRRTEVPQPNNAHYPPSNPFLTTFKETPSFPRIDMLSDTIATRGNHQPVWEYLLSDGSETRAGTTGIYTNPSGDLITGASKLGIVPEFWFFEVPGAPAGTPFDVFPGAPAVTDGSTIVFKGNYTVGGAGKTGVFYRDLVQGDINDDHGGGSNPVVLIANNTETLIPDTTTVFGSTSPPTAADGQGVFAGFDNEENPTLGGIYLALLAETPELIPLVRIGDQVPGERKGAVFNRLGEGVAFDGRSVAFWGAWGAMRPIRLHCSAEGNKDRIAFCLAQCPEPQGCSAKAPVSQGIFLHDIDAGKTFAVAKAPTEYGSFLFWNFSGMVPGVGGSENGSEEDGEPARWRSSAFVAVSDTRTAFKATSGNLVGIYLSGEPGEAALTVVDTRTDGRLLDSQAPLGSTVAEMGLEREGLRGDWLTISAKMAVKGGGEEDGMAGVYITTVPSK